MADDVHGTWRGVTAHRRAGERLCPPCSTWNADRAKAHNLISGKHKAIRVSTLAVARILRGWDPAEVLAGELGPRTLEALRGYRAGEQRG